MSLQDVFVVLLIVVESHIGCLLTIISSKVELACDK